MPYYKFDEEVTNKIFELLKNLGDDEIMDWDNAAETVIAQYKQDDGTLLKVEESEHKEISKATLTLWGKAYARHMT